VNQAYKSFETGCIGECFQSSARQGWQSSKQCLSAETTAIRRLVS